MRVFYYISALYLRLVVLGTSPTLHLPLDLRTLLQVLDTIPPYCWLFSLSNNPRLPAHLHHAQTEASSPCKKKETSSD